MIFLTSSVASVADHLYKNFLADKGFKTVLFVDTAAEPEVDGGGDWLQRDLQSLRDQGYQADRYTITGKDRDEIERKIDEYDILYMSGGNTGHLLNQLRKTGAFDLIVDKVRGGKPYIGTSAGSIVCGPRLPDYFFEDIPELEDTTCFNLVNFTLIPHWGDAYFKERYVGERLEKAYKDTQDPLLLLTDKQYVRVLDDGSFSILTT
jgi:dipeptidase E